MVGKNQKAKPKKGLCFCLPEDRIFSSTLNDKTKRSVMMKREERIVMRAIALCFKPFLKPEEALIYCNLERTQFAKKCEEYSIYKNNSGYFVREDLDRMLSGATSVTEKAAALTIAPKRRASYQA
jgi:hypothetical protein